MIYIHQCQGFEIHQVVIIFVEPFKQFMIIYNFLIFIPTANVT